LGMKQDYDLYTPGICRAKLGNMRIRFARTATIG
jgi:hypothetical protein